MSNCSFCSAMKASDAIIPHDILGGLIISGAALAGLLFFPAAWILWLVVLVVAVAITVDLSAHGWRH